MTTRDGWQFGSFRVGEPTAHDTPEADPSNCPKCGEWRDSPADCANCGYHEHRASEEADRGGVMDGTCLDCGETIWRPVGPWRTKP